MFPNRLLTLIMLAEIFCLYLFKAQSFIYLQCSFNIDFFFQIGECNTSYSNFQENFRLSSDCIRKPKIALSSDEDDDVAVERERIYADRDNKNRDTLRMIDLVKV